MIKNNFKKLKSVLIISFLFSMMSISTHAQLPPGFDDDVDDETPAAPIDGFLGLGIAAGTLIAFNKFRNK